MRKTLLGFAMIAAIALVVLPSMGCNGCGQATENAIETTGEAVQKAGEKIEQSGDKVGDAIDETAGAIVRIP